MKWKPPAIGSHCVCLRFAIMPQPLKDGRMIWLGFYWARFQWAVDGFWLHMNNYETRGQAERGTSPKS